MPLTGRKKVVVSRRRREDEGEEEGSVAGDLEDDSLSEGSVISNGDEDADVEPSDISEDENARTQHLRSAVGQPEPSLPTEHRKGPDTPTADSKFITSSDTEAMMNGLRLDDGKDVPEIDFDEPTADAVDPRPQSNGLAETPAERSRREHLEYLRQRNENPAFVPNRGGFFLHDNRAAQSGPKGFREPTRGRGRGGPGGFQPSRVPPFAAPTDQPWAHDLHDSVSTTATSRSMATPTLLNAASSKAPTTLHPPSQTALTRSFSTSVLLGKVPVIIHLPGMQERRTVQNVAKKKHTLLPQHRPPLRRDKPVRVSLPNQQPRYIFPSTERSFIFIPRALRPNQQGFGRGRGRSSFTASRRTSAYGGSTYTPSVGLSRRSSLGAVLPADGFRSPGGSAPALPGNYVGEPGKPVVRFPPPPRPLAALAPPATKHVQAFPHAVIQAQAPVVANRDKRENVPDALTMHQPRPQKTVSVADIEAPGRYHLNPPPQQQEQPFHQQMPVPANHQAYVGDGTGHNIRAGRLSHVSQRGGTPLSQIPERAIYAQPFQPFPVPSHAPGYLPAAYPPGALFYPTMPAEISGYGSGVMPPSLPPPYLASVHPPPYVVAAAAPAAPPARAPADDNVPAGTVAHETNGMVYYFDSAQLTPSTSAPYSAPFPGAAVGGMITPPHHFFYPAANSGVYYAAP